MSSASLPSALLLLVAGAALPACSGGGTDAPTPSPVKPVADAPAVARPDVILVTVDTTRADHIGAYGDDKADTTWLDALAARGTRFDRAYAVQPLTIPGHASIFTGLYPHNHGIRSNGDAILEDEHVTLAERLAEAGYQTGASVAAFVTTRQWGFDQGFDAYYDDLKVEGGKRKGGWHDERPAQAVIDDALGWLGEVQPDRPVFLWVHLYDAHFPYEPPERYLERWQSDGYRGEIAYVDDQLERLAAGVSAAGRDPLWVVVGDHGESLGDHRELTHGLYTYDATQRVPWIMAGPGIDTAVVDTPVSVADVAPTVLKLVGLDLPEGIDGQPQPGPARPIYTEAYQLTERFQYAPHVAIVDGSSKLIDKPKPELYDLAADPGELSNLAADQGEQVGRLRELLARVGATHPSTAGSTLDPESVARLEALGYLSGGDYEGVDFSSLPDPLDRQGVINRSQQVELMVVKGELDQAIRLLKEIVASDPELYNQAMRLAGLQARKGQKADALATIEGVLARQPDDPSVLYRAAVLVGQAGEHERALDLARKTLELEPDNAGAAEVVASALGNLGRTEEVVAFAESFLSRVPDAAGVATVPGILLFDQGQVQAGEIWLRRAMKADRPAPGVAPRLASLAQRAGKLDDAEKLLRAELERESGAVRVRGQLVGVLLAKGDRGGAKEQLDVLLATPLRPEATPEQRFERSRWLHSRSGLRIDAGDLAGAREDVEAGLALLPDDPDLVLMLANLLRQEGKEAEALETKARAEALHAARVEAMKDAAEKAAAEKAAAEKAAAGQE